MDDELLKIFRRFHEKFIEITDNETNDNSNEAIKLYYQIIDILSSSYENHRKYIPYVLATLEHFNTKSISYSFPIFFKLFDKIIKSKNIQKYDTSIFEEKYNEKTIRKFMKLLEESMSHEMAFRISDFRLNNNLSKKEIREILSFYLHFFQDKAPIIIWSTDEFQAKIMELTIFRYLSNELENPALFYFFPVGLFLDKLNTSEYYQHARDIAEEITISGFKDNLPEFGFFNSFRCYSAQGNIHTAVLYANLSLSCSLKNNKPLTDKYMQEMLWQTLKFLRNIHFFNRAIDIYEKIPSNLFLSDYERRALDFTYFSCLFYLNENDFPNKVLEYLDKERENILNNGPTELMIWLIFLYNIKRVYINSDFSISGLGLYLNLFEQIVSKENIEKQKLIVDGDSSKLKEVLKQSLTKLNETRNISDIVYDNGTALTIANRLIEDGFLKKDEEAILLAMVVKSDFSLVFNQKESEEIRPFVFDKDIHSGVIHNNKQNLLKNTSVNEPICFIWLVTVEGQVFQLSLFKDKYIFDKLIDWNWLTYMSICNSNYFAELQLNDSSYVKNGVIYQVFDEDYLEQSTIIANDLNFCRLNISTEVTSIHLVKDMELAMFPHNLLLDSLGRYIHLANPISNILSTEWYLSNTDQSSIRADFSKSIWIPTKGGNFTLEMLYSNIENILNNCYFQIDCESTIKLPMSSDINVVCSHGAEDIATNQVIYPNENAIHNVERIIGNGKILIFFICHSGSYRNEIFRNSVTSLVKIGITSGYKAVIAPAWALNIKIIPIWLEAFMCSLNHRDQIDIAVFKANLSVYEKYKTPAAWASMHLYGNPHLKID